MNTSSERKIEMAMGTCKSVLDAKTVPISVYYILKVAVLCVAALLDQLEAMKR